MASKLLTRIQKLEESTTPKIPPVIQVWLTDEDGNHERRTATGEVIRMNAAEWQEHVKKDGGQVIIVKWQEDEPAR